MNLERDLSKFFKSRQFANKIVTIGGKTVSAIFDADYVAISTDGADAEASVPAITGASSELDGYPHDTPVTIHDPKTMITQSFKVAERRPDGTGVTVIMLRAV